MEPPPAEPTFICIDNSGATGNPFIFRAQVDAVKFYCEILFKSNPDNAVCLFLMTGWRILVGPTRDLKEILKHLEYVPCGGDTKFTNALAIACATLSYTPTHMKRRLLMFLASRIDLEFGCIHPSFYGRELKKKGVVVNVFNFLSKTNKYSRDLLDSFYATVNSDGMSSIQDVHGELSRIRDMLSESILKENLDYISKMACNNEKNGAAAGVRDIEISDLSDIKKRFGPGRHDNGILLDLPTPERAWTTGCVSVERIKETSNTSVRKLINQEKTKEGVSVKQKLEQLRNQEKAKEDVSVKQKLEQLRNQAKAKQDVTVKQKLEQLKNQEKAKQDVSVKQKLEQLINQERAKEDVRVKQKLELAYDDEGMPFIMVGTHRIKLPHKANVSK